MNVVDDVLHRSQRDIIGELLSDLFGQREVLAFNHGDLCGNRRQFRLAEFGKAVFRPNLRRPLAAWAESDNFVI